MRLRKCLWLAAALLLAGCDVPIPNSIVVLPTVLGSTGGAAERPSTVHSASLPVNAPVLQAMVEQVATSAGMPSGLAKAVAEQESGWNPQAVSPAGAEGLMQLMPETIQDINRAGQVQVVDPFDAEQNARGGCWYLSWVRNQLPADKVESGEEWKLALAGYNGGIGRVQSAITHALSGAPLHPRVRWQDIASDMPGETQRYVPAVVARWQRYGD